MRRSGSRARPFANDAACAEPRINAALGFMGHDEPKRTYLVVIDDSPEARVALRFAARRAIKTNGEVEILAIVEPQDFVQWGGVQAAIEEEQKLRIEGVVSGAVGEIMDESGLKPSIVIRTGEPVKVVREYIGERQEVAALVLGAAPAGSPGPAASPRRFRKRPCQTGSGCTRRAPGKAQAPARYL